MWPGGSLVPATNTELLPGALQSGSGDGLDPGQLELATQSSNELDSKRPNDTIFIHLAGKCLVSTCYRQHSRATDRKDRVLAAQGSTQSGLRGSAAGCGV